MKTWKIIVNCVLLAFGLLSILVSVFGLKNMTEHKLVGTPLYIFSIFSIVLGAICCLGSVIWISVDLYLTWKNPDNAIDEKGHYSKYKIKRYKYKFSAMSLPTLNKKNLDTNSNGYFVNDLKFSDEYIKSQQTNKNKSKTDKIAIQIAQRKQRKQNNKKKDRN